MAVEIWLTEHYFKEFQDRKGVLFTKDEATDVYIKTQELQSNWPRCLQTPPPEVGTRSGVHYFKFNWPKCRLRICFGARRESGIDKVIALTCRTKQELSKGSSNGTREWNLHMDTEGVDLWDSYRRGFLRAWKIY